MEAPNLGRFFERRRNTLVKSHLSSLSVVPVGNYVSIQTDVLFVFHISNLTLFEPELKGTVASSM